MTRRASFTQAELKRAVAVVKAVGGFRVVVDNGRLLILPDSANDPLPSADDAEDAWDRALGLR